MFCVIDNEITKISDSIMSLDNVFGMFDSLVETVRLYNTKPLFINEHIAKMLETMDVLSFPYPNNFSVSYVSRQITRLLNVNKVYKGGICKICVFRKASIFSHEETDTQSQFIIFVDSLAERDFEFNTKGISLAIIPSVVIQKPYLYTMYSAHMLTQRKIPFLLQKTGADALTFFTEYEQIFHTSAGDIFYVKNMEVYCPNAEINTFRHPLTNHVIDTLKRQGIAVHEAENMFVDDIMSADEVFVTHPITGIQWVVRVNDKIVSYSLSKKIYSLLQQIIDV
ncbi:MAG: aminotransferase class IV [Bacteroidales bacterium]|jgi:branched-subunit amino acid aminotransferase/4-amino-4-deoxychorismate lyase|nr:aminotransferase class IV [Bacteroidales bacterium]